MDRNLYRVNMQKEILNTPNLSVLQGSVADLILLPGMNKQIVGGIQLGKTVDAYESL